MLQRLVRFAVGRWRIVVVLTVAFAAIGWDAFRSIPIEAYPDVTDPQVDVVGVYPGQSAEEVEKRVTIELEHALAGIPHLRQLRSVSVFGLSLVTLTFEDAARDFESRTLVAERLRDATLPSSASVTIGPQATPAGQIYRYTLNGTRSLRELRALNELVVERSLRAIDGVADVWTFGGFERQYQVRIDPVRLAAAGVSFDQVHRAVARTNANAGGGYVTLGSQELVVRGIGAVTSPADIALAVVEETNGIPVRVGDVAEIVEGSTPRRGSVGRGHEDEVVEGIVMLRRGENPSVVLDRLHARIRQLEAEVLPKDVRIVPFYDRTELVAATLSTVAGNMIEGVLVVVLVLYAFLRSVRAALVVAIVIPISLLAAFVGLRWLGLPANLISLGAVDFGILVDGAVIVVEATLHLIDHEPCGESRSSVVARAASLVVRPVAFSILVIVTALAPIFALERVEGRIFAPMAYTYAFALAGALVASIFVVPALARVVLPQRPPTGDARWLASLRDGYLRAFDWAGRHRRGVLAAAAVCLVTSILVARDIGYEFLPELNEGGLYITTTFPSTISLDETKIHTREIRERILTVPEVIDVLSHIGRPEAATQAEGPFNVELFVPLADEARWRPGHDRPTLERELRALLADIPGATHNFSQPITDRVFETISGIIGQVVVKVHGDDLEQMTSLAERVASQLRDVPGVTDLALYQAGTTPQLRAELDRDAVARRGLAIADIQETIEIALGGAIATRVWDGERRFDVALRLPDSFRRDVELLGLLPVGDPDRNVTLADVSKITVAQGRSSIWREDGRRFLAVKFNVRGRDLGSTVEQAKRAVGGLELPDGVYVTWTGEQENQARAMRRLGVVLPFALGAIFAILSAYFGSTRPAVTILGVVPFALAGAVAGLRLMGESFSVSSAVGCIAAIGQVVLAGVIVCSGIDERRRAGSEDAAREALAVAFRPVLATTSLAVLGLLPAALSHAMGSETQRPFAIAIITGLIAAAPATLFLLPLVHAGSRAAARDTEAP